MGPEKTLGEKRVRTEFNPSASGVVDQIKQKSAELINLVNTIDPKGGDPEVIRLIEQAAGAYEAAAMWAVKAATA